MLTGGNSSCEAELFLSCVSALSIYDLIVIISFLCVHVFPLSQSICMRGMGVDTMLTVCTRYLNDCVLDSSFWDIVAWFILYFINIMYILCIPFEPIYMHERYGS